MKCTNCYTIVFLLLFFFSCSSDRFAKRQYLSGRYVDKIEVPVKSNSVKTEEFILEEYPLTADGGERDLPVETIKDSICNIQTEASFLQSNTLDNKNNSFRADELFSPPKLNVSGKLYEENSQEAFDEKLKKAAIKTVIAGLLCLISMIGMYVFFLVILPLIISGSTLPFVLFMIVSLLLILAKIFLVLASFKSLSEARKIAENNKDIKNKDWTYVVMAANVIVSLYILGFILFNFLYIIFFLLGSLV
jgi:hypothetical protein